jgi:hypothetical protein
MLHAELRPSLRRTRPKTFRRIGQVSANNTGQLIESSTKEPSARFSPAKKEIPPLPMLCVNPLPAHFPGVCIADRAPSGTWIFRVDHANPSDFLPPGVAPGTW